MKISTFLLTFFLSILNSFGQDIWTQKADYGGRPRYGSIAFSIGQKGYLGSGNAFGMHGNDFWEFDPDLNIWTQKADIPETAGIFGVSFSIGNKGYLGTGHEENDGSLRKDFWEYDPFTNTFTRKADFAGTARRYAAGFSIGSKGYIGTGYDGGWTQDFWEYDPLTDSWIRKADFLGGPTIGATGINIGNKGYIGTGYTTGYGPTVSFFEYDPTTDNWTRKSDFPGSPRYWASGFTIGNKGFIGTGYGSNTNDFWEYTPTSDTWIKRADFPGPVRVDAASFSIGNKAYLGTGFEMDGTYKKDFWEYNPINSITLCNQTWMLYNLNVSTYRNGDPIPQVTDPIQWNSLTTGAWCYYNNDPSTEATYGKLYNWYAVNDPRGLAPAGWRIPNNSDWSSLESCLGGYFVAGGTLKEAGTSHWESPNTGATNSSGFTALPGGSRSGGGNFTFLGTSGFWWSSNAGQYSHFGILIQGGYYRSLFKGSAIFFGNEIIEGYPFLPIYDFKSGLSVRCVRDCLPKFSTCPSNLTLHADPENCSVPVTYTATFTGPPETTIQYAFTGATSGTGSGTGSGQYFNPGVTQVVLRVATSCGTDSCKFIITVIDNIPPIVNCPPNQVLCFTNTNQYSIPAITASDKCGIKDIIYTINGATNRSGIGPNASGAFNPGQSVVSWIVTDSAGNSSTCQTSIRIDYPLSVSIPNTYPLPIWGDMNTIYKGFGPACVLLIALPDGGTRLPGNRYRYQWSNGSTSQFIYVCPQTVGQNLYTVTITDSLGCQASATKVINVKDVRCGPNLDKVIICRPAWLGNGQACVSQAQAVLALLFGARLGGCNQLLTTTGAQKATEPSSIFESTNRNLSVSPNPNTGSFTVRINNLNATEIRVLDQSGRIIYRKSINETIKSQTINMNLGNPAKGLYIIQAISKDGVQSCKMMIQ